MKPNPCPFGPAIRKQFLVAGFQPSPKFILAFLVEFIGCSFAENPVSQKVLSDQIVGSEIFIALAALMYDVIGAVGRSHSWG